ncbi:MAG TPA: uracil-DNA glycosylase [Clostridiales bacterium]|nr:uracil-DNA glycosylase [Clostridiales bacterium]
MFCISKSWYELLKDEFKKPYYKKLKKFLENEYQTKVIYPKPELVFNSINHIRFEDVKVVIIGQDPYHEPNQAHGLSFSVENGVELPPSLVNIFKEIKAEYGFQNTNGNLKNWVRQGVLLLNSVLTVQKGHANSHRSMGWENLTQKIIDLLNQRNEPLVFILWGASAQKIGANINTQKHLVLKSVHPSPLSAYGGFFGCNHFKKANEFLKLHGKTEIDWRT